MIKHQPTSPLGRIRLLFVFQLLIVQTLVLAASWVLVTSISNLYEENILADRERSIGDMIEHSVLEPLISENEVETHRLLRTLIEATPTLIAIRISNEDHRLITQHSKNKVVMSASHDKTAGNNAIKQIITERTVTLAGEIFGYIHYQRDIAAESTAIRNTIKSLHGYYLVTMSLLLTLALTVIYLRVHPLFSKILHLSLHDALTNIPNRRMFDEVVALRLGAAKREQEAVGFILIDIDHFKRYNDHYGHSLGDSCLKRVGDGLIKAAHRASDITARIGGEEFAIFISGHKINTAALAEKCRSEIERLAIDHKNSLTAETITISVGFVERRCSPDPQQQLTMERLYQLADKALYQAKHGGRNCTREYQPDGNVIDQLDRPAAHSKTSYLSPQVDPAAGYDSP